MDFEFMYLLQDGLLREIPTEGASIDIGGVRHGPTVYALTDKGVDLVRRWREGRPIEDQPSKPFPQRY
jgi:DNA-binding PadR family transcriptional regulator